MKRIKIVLGSLVSALAFLPALAFAQSGVRLQNLGTALNDVQYIMDRIVPMLIGLAVIVFLWGVLKFVFNAGDEDKRKEGRQLMVWGIVGIVVMVSVWGLVAFVQNTFGVGNINSAQNIPQLP
jgi:uncharacterized membrane protein YidH (DUF202 family)